MLVRIVEGLLLLGTGQFQRIRGIVSDEGNAQWKANPGPAFQLFASSVSIFFLALVSLERAFAVLCPFRHGTAILYTANQETEGSQDRVTSFLGRPSGDVLCTSEAMACGY